MQSVSSSGKGAVQQQQQPYQNASERANEVKAKSFGDLVQEMRRGEVRREIGAVKHIH